MYRILQINLWLLISILVLSTPLLAQQKTLLEDFENIRIKSDGHPLWTAQAKTDPLRIVNIGGFNAIETRVYDVEGGLGGAQVRWSVQFKPALSNGPRYPFPQGFMRHWVKSAEPFDSETNRMSFWIRCDKDIANLPNGVHAADDDNGNWFARQSFNIGTYVKHHHNSNTGSQGQHYYHFFVPGFHANQWIKAVMNWAPTARVGTPGSSNWPPDPEYVGPTTGGEIHYFDGLTRFYASIELGTPPFTCQAAKFEVYRDFNEPEEWVRTMTVSYTGSRYEISATVKKGVTRNYEFAFSTHSMKSNGFESGSLAGVVRKRSSSYPGIILQTAEMPENPNGLYFAIRPEGERQFMEIFFEGSPSGTSPELPSDSRPSTPTNFRLI